MLNPEEKLQLFNRFPALELSYEPKLHKKVHSSLYYIIPKGPKALVWYTYWGEENVCFLVLLNERGNYSDIRITKTVFSDAMALGTIIYGTHFIHQNRPYFTCEQLYYYKGIEVIKTKSYTERLNILLEMFQNHIEQIAYTSDSLMVGLPVMTNTYEEAQQLMNELPYRTYGIGIPSGLNEPPMQAHAQAKQSQTQAKQSQTQAKQSQAQSQQAQAQQAQAQQAQAKQYQHHPQGQAPAYHRKTIFKVKAELAADTYSLYTVNDNSLVGTAMVPTYKCSVLLNSLFRTIKENTNLDLLEESDDEDEFENTQLDKFVDLEKTILMECVFLKRFQKWQPIQLIKV